jgi:hypothetical protein
MTKILRDPFRSNLKGDKLMNGRNYLFVFLKKK